MPRRGPPSELCRLIRAADVLPRCVGGRTCSMPNQGSSPLHFSMAFMHAWRVLVGIGVSSTSGSSPTCVTRGQDSLAASKLDRGAHSHQVSCS